MCTLLQRVSIGCCGSKVCGRTALSAYAGVGLAVVDVGDDGCGRAFGELLLLLFQFGEFLAHELQLRVQLVILCQQRLIDRLQAVALVL